VAGSGGMGIVYRALDLVAGEPVALKILHAYSQTHHDRFSREAQVLAELSHPAIVRYVAHGTSGASRPFIAMEWLEGETLAGRLGREAVSIAETVAFGRRVAEALAVAHRGGIVHRDLKPGNLFLVGGAMARVKVLDFGIARVESDAMLTRTGTMLGTPGYMAPEQARGERDIDVRADVFALGCVLFRCLTGRGAFEGEDAMTVLLKIVLEDAPHPRELVPSIPAALDALVMQMLAKARADRPADGAAVAAALAGLGTIEEGPPPSAVGPPPALTASERRAVSLVLARVGSGPGLLDSDVATISPTELAARRDGIRQAVEALGERLELLADGSLLVPVSTSGAPTDQAAQAARCALAIQGVAPDVRAVVVSGRAVLSGIVPIGEIIERAVHVLGEAAPGTIRLDETSAGLVAAKFEVGGDDRGLLLRGRRELADARRTLLGKPTPCVGRDRELAALDAFFAECAAEPLARPVLVTAPAGVGKSRLRHEFVRRLVERRSDVEVWLGRGDPIRAGSPFGLIAPALRRACGVGDGEPIEIRRRKVRARVARHVPEADVQRVAEFVGELTGVRFADDFSVQLRTARQDAVLMSDQMRRAWEDLVAAETARHPLLLVLEDLHWGDLPTVQFVDGALRLLPNRPLMVLAVARPEVHELFPKLWSAREVQEIRLGGLTQRGGERLVREVLGDGVDDATVGLLVERAGGNAFYLEELIRAAAEGRGDALPETVLAMAQARLERLDPEARRILRAASVFGQVFWASGVKALLGGDAQTGQLSEWLDLLGDQEFVSAREGRRSGERELAFRHGLVREAAYAMLTDADRILGHRLAGDWLERAGEADAMVLAEHFERGGLGERAVEWYRRAAEQALEGNDLEAVEVRAERGVTCGAGGELLGALRLLQAQALRWRGHRADGEARAREAMRHLDRGTARWFAAMSEALLAAGAQGERGRIVELYRQLVATPAAPGDADADGVRLRAIARAATQLTFTGDLTLADEALAGLPGGGTANDTDDPTAIALADRARSWRQLHAGDVGKHLELTLSCLAVLEGIGDRQSACTSRANAGYAYMLLGEYDEAERYLVGAIADGRTIGAESTVAHAQHNLGLVLARKGRVAEGLAEETAARDLFRAKGNQRFEGACSTYLSMIRLLAGAPKEAAEDALSAVTLLESAPQLEAYARAALAQARLAQQEGEEALAAAREAMALVENVGEAESLIRLVHAECLSQQGLEADARAAIGAARASLLARAGKIADPGWRRSFLERVPENARTLTLARAWLGEP